MKSGPIIILLPGSYCIRLSIGVKGDISCELEMLRFHSSARFGLNTANLLPKLVKEERRAFSAVLCLSFNMKIQSSSDNLLLLHHLSCPDPRID